MNKKLSGVIGIILSIIVLVYFEPFAYRVLEIIGISLSSYSNNIQIIINIIIKLIMCFIVYVIYKKDFRRKRSSEGLLRNSIIFIVGLVSIVVFMYLFNYVTRFIADIFDVSLLEQNFYNIFDKQLDFALVVKIVTDYIIVPYLYCSIIILSIDKFAKRNDTFIILSGLLASIVHALMLSGTLGFVIVNSLSTFLLFSILAFIYKKNNSICFIILLYSFYLLSNVFILNYIGW